MSQRTKIEKAIDRDAKLADSVLGRVELHIRELDELGALADRRMIADRLSVPIDTVHKWISRGVFPEPALDELGLWNWYAVREWAKATKRTPSG